MRTMLDNSTVTSVLRALGEVPLKDKNLFDLDVSSLRTFIDHVLLSKKIFIPDNYIEEHSLSRKEFLRHPDISFFRLKPKLDEKALKDAIAHVHNWGLVNNFAQGYQDIFKEMNILFTHAWRNSEPFLVLSHFGADNKYNNSLLHQMMEGEVLEDVKSLKVKGYNKETIKVAQKISWAAIRTVYNKELSKVYGAEYVPHPVRNMFNAKCILFDNHPNTRSIKLSSKDIPRYGHSNTIDRSGRDQFIRNMNVFFKNFWVEAKKEDENIFGVSTYDIEMPPFLSYVLNQMSKDDTPKNVLEYIFELRERPDVVNLREHLYKIYFETSETDKNAAIHEFALELKDLKQRLQKYLGYNHEKVSLSLKVMSYQANVPRFMIYPYYPHKPRLAFVRDVILDLSNVSSLGTLHERLWHIKNRKK